LSLHFAGSLAYRLPYIQPVGLTLPALFCAFIGYTLILHFNGYWRYLTLYDCGPYNYTGDPTLYRLEVRGGGGEGGEMGGAPQKAKFFFYFTLLPLILHLLIPENFFPISDTLFNLAFTQ
jgi:hypothetical protein